MILTQNIRLQLKQLSQDISVKEDWDKVMVRLKKDDAKIEEQIVDALSRTPGIANFSRVKKYDFENLHDIYLKTQELWADELKGKTFCVRVKRTGQHEFTSTDAEKYIGGGLNQNTEAKGVKLKNPDITLKVEIKDNSAYLIEKRFEGLGGFPIGTQDAVLSLVSGGFDSTVTSYLMIKRGLKNHFCFFNLGGREHELGVKEIAFYLWNRYGSTHRVKFFTVPFDHVVSEILQKIDPANMGVVLKRMMLRAAEKLAEKEKIQALVTGEAVAQVSSQTVHNLAAIDSVTNMLVLRPLAVMDKPDIIGVARKIGTEEFSANIPEYCGVISVKPSAKVCLKSIDREEGNFDFSLLDEAVDNVKIQKIDAVMADVESAVSVDEVTEIPSNGVVIDIRHDTERDLKPLDFETVNIPFYSLNTAFKELDRSKVYLLYCDKGVMSKMHAGHLIEQGYKNVAVFKKS